MGKPAADAPGDDGDETPPFIHDKLMPSQKKDPVRVALAAAGFRGVSVCGDAASLDELWTLLVPPQLRYTHADAKIHLRKCFATLFGGLPDEAAVTRVVNMTRAGRPLNKWQVHLPAADENAPEWAARAVEARALLRANGVEHTQRILQLCAGVHKRLLSDEELAADEAEANAAASGSDEEESAGEADDDDEKAHSEEEGRGSDSDVGVRRPARRGTRPNLRSGGASLAGAKRARAAAAAPRAAPPSSRKAPKRAALAPKRANARANALPAATSAPDELSFLSLLRDAVTTSILSQEEAIHLTQHLMTPSPAVAEERKIIAAFSAALVAADASEAERGDAFAKMLRHRAPPPAVAAAAAVAAASAGACAAQAAAAACALVAAAAGVAKAAESPARTA